MSEVDEKKPLVIFGYAEVGIKIYERCLKNIRDAVLSFVTIPA